MEFLLGVFVLPAPTTQANRSSSLKSAIPPDLFYEYLMNAPARGLRFRSLKGEGKGRHAVDASGNWRIIFGWDGEDAIEVGLEDYH